MNTTANGISILISTYNGKDKLGPTLMALAALDTTGISTMELIVVDNASTDGTSELTRKTWDSLGAPFPLRLISEPKPGKLNAQETGMKLVQQPFVLICDDDNALHADYLQLGLHYLMEHPRIGVLGGNGIAVSTVPIPDWFEAFAYYFACAPQAPATGEVRPTRNVVYGAGMWIRMEGYHRMKANGFRFLIASRTGTSLSTGGEDSELCWAIRFLGYEIWYVDEMRFQHHVPANRLTPDYRERLLKGMYANGPLGGIYLRIAKGELHRPKRLFWLKELLYTLKDLILLPFGKEPNRQQETWRMWNNIRYFIRERSNYDRAIIQVLDYKQRCQ